MFSALDIKTLMQGTLYGDPSLRVDTIRPIHSPLVGALDCYDTWRFVAYTNDWCGYDYRTGRSLVLMLRQRL